MLTANLENIWLKFNEIKNTTQAICEERHANLITSLNIKAERALTEVSRLNSVNTSLRVESER